MNLSKFEAAQRELSIQAKKVYECIPIAEPWSPAQIMRELHRRNISMSDHRVVMGCINTMIDNGMVNEVTRGMFQREEVRATPTQETATHQEPELKKTPTPILATTSNPLDRLSSFATRLRDLANDMENAALEMAGQAEKNELETAKMRQLQALLKSLG